MEMELEENHLTLIDYLVVVVTVVGSLGIGLYFALKKKQTTEDLLVGGRNMGPLPVAASMLATYLSAIAILGYPSEIFYHGIEMYTMPLMQIFIAPLAAYVVVPVFYHMKLTSVFEYLECRFESVASRWIGALIGICQFFFFMGVILFAPSIALEHIVGIPFSVSIVGIGLCGTAYTAVGGLKAVVWTDVFQLIIIFISLASIIFSKAFSPGGGILHAFHIASENGRLKLFNFAVDPFMRHNTLNFLVGFGFTMFCSIGTHQPQVQRYSSLPSVQHAQKAILVSILLSIVTMGLLVVTGIVIFANYSTCDPKKSKEIKMDDQIVPYYVVKELSMIPGMLGMFISCIFSAVLSTVSSALNSAAAVTWEDFLIRIPCFAKMTEKAKAHTTRVVAAIYGLVTIKFAFGVQHLGTGVLPLTLTIVGATNGPIGAIFILGIFVPWINKYGANAGMLVGIATMFSFSIRALQLGVQHIPLPTSTEGCLEEIVARNVTQRLPSTIEWPDKIFAISYLLFPFLGAVITVIVSVVVSAATGGCRTAKNVDPQYLHPWIRKGHKVLRVSTIKTTSSVDAVLNSTNVVGKSTLPSYRYDPVPTELVTMTRAQYEQETVGDSIVNGNNRA